MRSAKNLPDCRADLHTLRVDLLAGLIIFAAHVVSSITGFGSGVLGLPPLALVIGLDTGKTSLLLLSATLYLWLALREYRHIARRELLQIVILAGLGIPLGIMLYRILPRH